MSTTHSAKTFRALVVDDDPVVRTMICFALKQEGFQCDTAEDGREALSKLESTDGYELLVSDLRMPNCHGYELLCDVLSRRNRPAVMVHTAVTDPVLAQDLIRRGVDDVSFKPGNYPLLALRARVLAQRNARDSMTRSDFDTATPEPQSLLDRHYVDSLCRLPGEPNLKLGTPTEFPQGMRPIDEQEFRQRLRQLTNVLPVSQAALDVVKLIQEGEAHVSRIAAVAAREPSLAVEILKLANSAYFNPGGQHIADLEQAVMRIGLRRVSELAIATSTLLGLTTSVMPWLDTSLLWRRSLAAAVAWDLIAARAQRAYLGPDLFLPALLHGLGRLAVGALYPREYEQMVAACRQDRGALVDLERKIFPLTSLEVAATLLELWRLPEEVIRPLHAFQLSFCELRTRDVAQRQQTELLKVCVLIGYLAAGKWEPWDQVDLPPAGWSPLAMPLPWHEILDATRDGVRRLTSLRKLRATTPLPQVKHEHQFAYAQCDSSDELDLLPVLTRALGFAVQDVTASSPSSELPRIVNAIGLQSVHALSGSLPASSFSSVLIITDQSWHGDDNSENVVTLPCSVAALRQALARFAQEATTVFTPAMSGKSW